MTANTVIKLDPKTGRLLKIEAATRGVTMKELVSEMVKSTLMSLTRPENEKPAPTAAPVKRSHAKK
jgi:hypothetical protein